MSRPDGFTLIELVIVMLIISGGMLGLTAAFSNSSKSLTINESAQQAAQYAQECAEHALATRRNSGFAATSNFSCTNPGAAVTSLVLYDSTGTCNGHNPCPCPSGGTDNCRDIGIRGSSGSLTSSITIMLVDY